MSTRTTSPMSERLSDLFTQRTGPCVSIYMPTGRRSPERQRDTARFRQLVDQVGSVLTAEFPVSQAEELMAPLLELAGNERFWEHTLDGMAVLRASDFYNVYNLQRTVPERAIVADSFHIKPLLRIAQSADRFHVLAIARDHARLFQGDRYVLDEVQLDPGFPNTLVKALGEPDNDPQEYADTSNEIDQQTQRFFRVVDRAVSDQYSKLAGIPLILASLHQNQSTYRAVSRNAQLVDEGIAINPDALTPDDLRERAWNIAEPRYLARLAELVDEIEGNARKIKEMSGVRTKYYRSGTAYYDEVAVKVSERLGHAVIGFSILGDAGATYNRIQVKSALLMARPGDIAILHMNHPEGETAEGVIAAVPELKRLGFRFVKLSEYELQ